MLGAMTFTAKTEHIYISANNIHFFCCFSCFFARWGFFFARWGLFCHLFYHVLVLYSEPSTSDLSFSFSFSLSYQLHSRPLPSPLPRNPAAPHRFHRSRRSRLASCDGLHLQRPSYAAISPGPCPCMQNTKITFSPDPPLFFPISVNTALTKTLTYPSTLGGAYPKRRCAFHDVP